MNSQINVGGNTRTIACQKKTVLSIFTNEYVYLPHDRELFSTKKPMYSHPPKEARRFLCDVFAHITFPAGDTLTGLVRSHKGHPSPPRYSTSRFLRMQLAAPPVVGAKDKTRPLDPEPNTRTRSYSKTVQSTPSGRHGRVCR